MEMTTTMNSPMVREDVTGFIDADLVSTAQKGDLEAFNQLVIRYQERIYNLALRILGDEESAEDVTQDTFLKAYRYLHTFRGGSFQIWLYRIATNACYDELRRRKRHPVLPLEYEDETEESFFPRNDLQSFNLPEKELERHESERLIRRALNRLDANHRAVVTLVDLQDFDYTEAAQILGIPIGTLKSRLARARVQLCHLLY